MPDWKAIVEEQLARLALEPAEKAEVLAELAGHVEDSYEALRKHGMTEEQAAKQTLARAGNWQDLCQRIPGAKRREQPMKTRIQQLWIPGFLTLITSMVLFAVFQKLDWPSRVAANGSLAIFLAWPWLASLPVLGALGAHLSLRGGGSRGTAALVSVFPPLALTVAFVLMFPIGFALERITGKPVDFGSVAVVLLRDWVGWIAVQGAVLLVGGFVALLLGARSAAGDAAIG